jgi:D-ribose pyranose/furanose isomerase RbsD
MCSLAESRLALMMEEIFDGSVTLEDMIFILEKQAQVERLCAANETYKPDEVKSILKRRKLECDTFRIYKVWLDSFCSKLATSKVEVTGELNIYAGIQNS